jgi:pimeloyl-ACP methyl ester carboxylesterase
VNAAKSVWAPVLVIHGANDRDTPPAHSQRVHAALAGPKRLILVERAGHNGSLGDPAVWVEIDKWLQDLMTRAAAR